MLRTCSPRAARRACQRGVANQNRMQPRIPLQALAAAALPPPAQLGLCRPARLEAMASWRRAALLLAVALVAVLVLAE